MKKLLDRDVREAVEYYTAGVNSCIEESGPVFELKLLKCIPDRWEMEDTMRLAKALLYLA